jgi:hypothetical protein
LQPPEVDYSGEGRSDETIARRLILAADAIPGVSFAQGRRAAGISALDHSLAGLNESARHRNPVLVLRDLDDDPRCAAALVRDLLPARSPRCLLRICVREIEAWLMADRDAYARFLGVHVSLVPEEPDEIPDPKRFVLGWATSGKSAKLARRLEAGRKAGAANWQVMGELHGQFAELAWDPIRAAASGRSLSLSRALSRLRAVVADERPHAAV